MTTTPTKNEKDEGKSTPETPDTQDASFDDDGNDDSDEECPFDETQPRFRLGSITTAIPRTTTTTTLVITHEEKVLGIAARDVGSGSGEEYHIRRPSSSSASDDDDASLSSEYGEGSHFCSFVVRTGTGIVSCLTVVLVILVVLFVSNKNNNKDSDAAALGGVSPAMPNVLAPSSASLFETKTPSSMAPADPFWDSPAMSPSSVNQKTKLVDFLTQATATETLSLNFETEDPTSRPNQLAIDWLLEEYAANTDDDLGDQLVYDDKLIQRFALVALDFALTAGRGGGGGDPPPFFATETTSNTLETNVGGATTWSTQTQDECAWFGIFCNGTVVTELNWARLGLTGSIPDSIAVLSDLTRIDFSSNALVGSIPESIYGLTELRSVYFYKNNLTGTLSDGIVNLQNLVHLMLNENDLAGPFPTTLRSSDTYFPPIGTYGRDSVADSLGRKVYPSLSLNHFLCSRQSI
jgi:hypothetical protein